MCFRYVSGDSSPALSMVRHYSSAVSVDSAEPCEEDAPEEKELLAVSTARASSGRRCGVHSGAGSNDTDTVRALASSSIPLPIPDIVSADVLSDGELQSSARLAMRLCGSNLRALPPPLGPAPAADPWRLLFLLQPRPRSSEPLRPRGHSTRRTSFCTRLFRKANRQGEMQTAAARAASASASRWRGRREVAGEAAGSAACSTSTATYGAQQPSAMTTTMAETRAARPSSR